MRISYVTETYPPELNGVSLTVARTVDYLAQRGHDIELIRPRQPHEIPCETESEWRTPGIPIPMYRDLRMGLPMLWRLRRRWQAQRPQLVHVATPGPLGWAAVRVASLMGIPLTADFRTNFHQYSRYYGFGFMERAVGAYLRYLHNAAQQNFVPTHAMRAQLAKQGFERLRVVGRGIDAQRFTPERRSLRLRESWGAGADAPVLLYVGRLAAEKNVVLACEAFECARKACPDVRMTVVGDGPLRNKLQAKHPDIAFVGVKRDAALARHYASADIFLFPSMTDTFGNVVLEAMASGLAVVSYDTAAAAEHIVHGKNGVLVRPDDREAFVEAACRLALQPLSALTPLRDAARATALHNGWRQVLGRFETHLLEATQAGATQGQPCPV